MSSIIFGIIFLIICGIVIFLIEYWDFIAIVGGLTLLICFFIYIFYQDKKRCKNTPTHQYRENVLSAKILKSETTYRTEEEEEFDIVMSDFLTQMDGWQHYETRPVEYTVENGLEYTFLIHYADDSYKVETHHESSEICRILLELSE